MNEETGNKMSPAQTKEERLAAKLRENLRRRKAQSREIARESGESGVSKGGEDS